MGLSKKKSQTALGPPFFKETRQRWPLPKLISCAHLEEHAMRKLTDLRVVEPSVPAVDV